jgi:hypothetical protein
MHPVPTAASISTPTRYAPFAEVCSFDTLSKRTSSFPSTLPATRILGIPSWWGGRAAKEISDDLGGNVSTGAPLIGPNA